VVYVRDNCNVSEFHCVSGGRLAEAGNPSSLADEGGFVYLGGPCPTPLPFMEEWLELEKQTDQRYEYLVGFVNAIAGENRQRYC